MEHRLRPGLLVCALVLATVGRASARPCESASDRAAVLDATAAIQAQCDCTGAASHRDYVICAERVAKQRKQQGKLPPQCINEADRCAKRSTCGRPGAVTCCRTNEQGRTKCTIKRSESACFAPPNGTATVGTCASCCQACGEGTCNATTRCCLQISTAGAFTEGDGTAQCVEVTSQQCKMQGGTDIGPGTCDATSCAAGTTTTTSSSTTSTTVTSVTGAFLDPTEGVHHRHGHRLGHRGL